MAIADGNTKLINAFNSGEGKRKELDEKGQFAGLMKKWTWNNSNRKIFALPDDLTLLLARSFHSVTERLQKDSLCREDIRLYTGAPNEEYSSKPVKYSIVKRILVFKQQI